MCESWETGIRRSWRDTLRQRDCEEGVTCHLIKLGLDPGCNRGPGHLKQGNDVTFFSLGKENFSVSMGHCGSRSQELSLISGYAYLGKR